MRYLNALVLGLFAAASFAAPFGVGNFPSKTAAADGGGEPDITTSLLLLAECNENTGTTVADTSGNGNNGSFNGTPAWAVGKEGSGIDTTSGYVSFGQINATTGIDQLTVSVWMKPTTANVATDENIVRKYANSGSSSWQLMRLSTERGHFWIKTSGPLGGSSEAGSLNTTDWVHLVGVYNGVDIRVYTNGVLASVDPQQAQTGLIAGSSANVTLGAAADSFGGICDRLRIYGRALTAADVAALFAAEN